MTGTVTLYFNTGFNGVDIPASASVLATAQQKTYPSVYFIREDIDKPSIKVQDTYEAVQDADYCKIQTANKTCYYFVGRPEVLAQGVISIPLDLDALLTMGGAANLNYVSGWQERGHIAKADDTLFGNVAAEDWVPSQPLQNRNTTTLTLNPQGHPEKDIVVSNIDIGELSTTPDDVQTVVEGVVSGETDAVMYFPSIKSGKTPAEFDMYDYLTGSYMSFTIPNTEAYDAGDPHTRRGIEKLFSSGQLQLQASYKIPAGWVGSVTAGGNGKLTKIVGAHGELPLTDLAFEYTEGGYTPKNKKVYATYRQYYLAALGSGDLVAKAPEDLYDGAAQPTVRLWADPCSTGKPYARWAYIKGSTIPFSDCAKGLQWSNSQLVMEGASGSMWNSINTAFANQSAVRASSQNAYNLSQAMAKGSIAAKEMELNATTAQIGGLSTAMGALVGAVNPASAFNQGVGLVANAQKLEYSLDRLQLDMNQAKQNSEFTDQAIKQQINENGINLLKNNNVVAPTINFTPEQNLGLYGYNYFIAYETRKSLDDLKSEDQYYQRYGYNGLHRPLTAQCFNERQYYNFVQAFDINLKSATSFGLRVRMKAISQLNAGVRVWKVLPDASYYELN